MHPAEEAREAGSERRVRAPNGVIPWAELYDRTSPYVFGVVLRILRDRAVAERLLQRIYLEAAGAWREVPEAQRLGWILRRARESALATLSADPRPRAAARAVSGAERRDEARYRSPCTALILPPCFAGRPAACTSSWRWRRRALPGSNAARECGAARSSRLPLRWS